MMQWWPKVILVTSVMLLSACAAFAPKPVLRVGTSATMAPLVFEQDGELQGLEADMALQLAARLNRKIKWQEMEFSELLRALERGDIDIIMAGMSVTERRARRVAFADSYMQSGQMLMFRRSDLGSLNSAGAARQLGRPFAVQAGSTGEQYVLREFPSAKIFRFDDTAAMVAALDAGQVDYLVQDAPAIWYYSLSRADGEADRLAFYQFLTHEPLAWAVSRSDAGLQGELNQALAAMQADGTLNKLINTWMPVRTQVEDRN